MAIVNSKETHFRVWPSRAFQVNDDFNSVFVVSSADPIVGIRRKRMYGLVQRNFIRNDRLLNAR
jgi:hypothetical protein